MTSAKPKRLLNSRDLLPRKRPDGTRQCRRCGSTEIPKNRLSWCSQACVDDYMMKSSVNYLRGLVLKRDKGICAQCGIDTEAERAKARFKGGWWEKANPRPSWSYDPAKNQYATGEDYDRAYRQWEVAKMKAKEECGRHYAEHMKPLGWPKPKKSWWEADHIVPVAEGGPTELPNIQTLCVPCHKAKTREQARRKAEARRGAVVPETERQGVLL